MNRVFWKELWLLLVCAFMGIAILMTVMPLLGLMEMNNVQFLHVMQWLQTVFVMILPALFWYWWRTKKNPVKEFGFSRINKRLLILTFCFMVVSVPALEFITVVNYNMPVPETVRPFLDEMKAQNFETTSQLMDLDGIGGWIELILLVCAGTAVAEETMFRGALYKCFEHTTIGRHWVACFVGLIFSLVHFDPSGFFPRWILGSFFCYLVIWSGSIWPSILAHALNNLFALIEFKNATGHNPLEPAEMRFSWYLVLLSFVLSVVIIWLLQQKTTSFQSE